MPLGFGKGIAVRTIPLAKAIVHSIGIAAIAIPLGASGPQAITGFRLNQGAVVVLLLGGNTSTTMHWFVQSDGFHVVTMIDTVQHGSVATDHTDRHSQVRFEAVLGPGQTETISVPEPQRTTIPAVRIQRIGDRLQVILSACERNA